MPVFLLVLLIAVLSCRSAAAAPVFPNDGTIGLEPPPGMARAAHGFVRGGASISVRNMVKEAYASPLNRGRESEVAVGGPEARVDPFPVGGCPGRVIRGRRRLEGVDYRVWHVSIGAPDDTPAVDAMVPVNDTVVTDAQIEAALRTITLRPPSLAARLAALWQQPMVAAMLHYLEVAAICGTFISIGAALFGPESSGRGRRKRPPPRRHLSGRGSSHGKG